ncbi:TetR/AcrR family transcriptional regulator [Streptomyces scopuliridis]|uniref:TetR/AcrR family transcriptional regulator n=1 Tax=Streptomyces scopuliridis TaxID=452529 RepID=A0ACD4ZM52_9ACTN|nr:TetR/AcrR family transcriptional regulator [Streptomyces scopuliridis]WSB35237.1 TetR/AcrR family transcriptional regulator [Streptomyces scopuliridis]WSB99479.1 TetR/AcrR family transcriptional regulator [Streptomyces scopuliridis]WSC06821.1 TetR/AcrR family transcriptional regulator [Streptomyces scopuliridis]
MTSTESAGSGNVARSLELLWGSGERPSRGPKPGLTLDRIITTAVALADAEGLDAVSMRRLSTELGTGTMSLYRYVPGKAELIDLMLNQVQGETAALTESLDPGSGWRPAAEAMARAALALHRRHPWLLSVNQARPVLGPNTVSGLEKTLSAIKGMGLSDPELISVIIMVEGYVTGVARTHVHAVEAEKRSGITDQEFWQTQEPVLSRAMNSGVYPVMASLSEEAFGPEFDHFEFGLQRILDGLEVLVERRAAERDTAG